MQQDVTRRPGRPKSEEKAAAIKHAAVGLFMTDGMERTSMDAIARSAGVSKQTLYSHFNSKEELFRSCVASKVEMYGLDASNLQIDDSIDALLKHIGRQYLTLLSDSGVIRMFRLMTTEADTHPGTVKSFYECGPLTTMRNIAGILSRHLPGAPDNDALAQDATNEFLALVRAEYFLEFLLGQRESISDDEMNEHLDHCIEQIHKLYAFT